MTLKPREETLELDYPIQLADRLMETVTIKRPTMGALKKHQVKGERDVDGEMRLFCALTGLRMEEMELVDAGDYARLQATYLRFRGSDAGTDSDDGAQS